MGQAAINLRRTAGDLRRIPMSGMIAAARAVKAIAVEEAGRATGGDGRLTGKKKRGIRLRARDDIVDHGNVILCRVQGSSVGGWVWVNTGTSAHRIRRRKRGPMRKVTVAHPGTRGKGAWRNVRKRSFEIVPKIFLDEVRQAVN